MVNLLAPYLNLGTPFVSIAKSKDFLVPDFSVERTRWGRIDQGRRELAVALRKDVTVEKLAELIGRSGPSLAQWKTGESLPTRDSLNRLEKLFLSAGLHRYTAKYLEYGGGEETDEPDLESSDNGDGVGEQRA